jgi:hypothetical protein
MKTFDEILPAIKAVLQSHAGDLAKAGEIIINRDLNGRIRLIAGDGLQQDSKNKVEAIARDMANVLGERVPGNQRVFFELSPQAVAAEVPRFSLPEFPGVMVADRLLTETGWTNIGPVSPGVPRVVFYSIKGGVGRSTALAAAAWALAEEGKKVLALDMDLESPGVSSSLLSRERAPAYGIADWLVEDLTDNDDAVFPYMAALSDLSRNGEIYIVPAYGIEPGEYIAKIGRAWMPKYSASNVREPWHNRLNRLLEKLETRYNPDVVLIDSRAGIDEISSACITGLGAASILLFSINSDQTWDGYKILFDSWLGNNAVQNIRERLQIAGALVPDTNSDDYIAGLCEKSWDLFTEKLYDPVSAGEPEDEAFNFDKNDMDAPHYPKLVRWNRGFAALPNLYQPLGQKSVQEQVRGVFGDLIEYIEGIAGNG